MLGWDCPEFCRYECALNDTARRRSLGFEVAQYHGSWPFRRVGPFIQFWSMLFSIGNFVPHWVFVCVRRYRHRFAPLTRLPPLPSGRRGELVYPLSPLLVLHGVVGMNAWFWSTIYHTRDVKWTQHMDVHCATLYVVFSVYILLLRLLGWDPLGRLSQLLALTLFGSFLLNFLYLDFVHWDFEYNLKLTILAVVLYAACGFLWYALHSTRPYAWKLPLLLSLLLLAGSLEVFDFPPLLHDTLDSHALWHLATIPLTAGWYNFVGDDTQFELALIGERKRRRRRAHGVRAAAVPERGNPAAPFPKLVRRVWARLTNETQPTKPTNTRSSAHQEGETV